MLTRIYLDNFRCFENFEFRPGRKQLILGANGAGKSSLVDAVLFLRQVTIAGEALDPFQVHLQRTRWSSKNVQTGEIEARLDDGSFLYRLVLEPGKDSVRTKVVSETLHLDGHPLFSFEQGEVRLYNDRFEHKVTYPFDWHRSAFATITPRQENRKLTAFKLWFSRLFCFRIDPFAADARSDGEHLFPTVRLNNFASWYRHLVQAEPRQNFDLVESLRHAMEGFNFLQLEAAGENVRILTAEFATAGGSTKFHFGELSEGQRCLICLYTILHFVLRKGCTVLIDEPDNFISLREIQPWLTQITSAIEDEGVGQALLISHHPEIIDQWAPAHGIQFVRESGGSVRAKEISFDEKHGGLPMSELVSRGWVQ